MFREPKLTFSLSLLPQFISNYGWGSYFHVSYMDARFRGKRFNYDGWQVRSATSPAIEFNDRIIWLWGEREQQPCDDHSYLSSVMSDYRQRDKAQAKLDEVIRVLIYWSTNWLPFGVETEENVIHPVVRESLSEIIPPEDADEETPAPLFVDAIRAPTISLF